MPTTYTPPVGRFGTTDEQHNAYLVGHSAGYDWARHKATTGAGMSTADAALRFVDSERWEHNSRPYLRAHEGFADGAAQYARGA